MLWGINVILYVQHLEGCMLYCNIFKMKTSKMKMA